MKMGFEGLIYYGVAGSTAATQLTNNRDITYNMTTEKGNTTVRGTGASPPIQTESVTLRVASIEFTQLNKADADDASLASMKTAAYGGTVIALRTKDYSAGKGFDGDVILEVSHPYLLAGEQVVTFTAVPTYATRAPSLYV